MDVLLRRLVTVALVPVLPVVELHQLGVVDKVGDVGPFVTDRLVLTVTFLAMHVTVPKLAPACVPVHTTVHQKQSCLVWDDEKLSRQSAEKLLDPRRPRVPGQLVALRILMRGMLRLSSLWLPFQRREPGGIKKLVPLVRPPPWHRREHWLKLVTRAVTPLWLVTVVIPLPVIVRPLHNRSTVTVRLAIDPRAL